MWCWNHLLSKPLYTRTSSPLQHIFPPVHSLSGKSSYATTHQCPPHRSLGSVDNAHIGTHMDTQTVLNCMYGFFLSFLWIS